MAEEFGEEIITGVGKDKSNGAKPSSPWDKDFGGITDSDIDRILKVPAVDDMAGILVRGNFKSDDERIRYLRVIKRCQKFDMEEQLEFIRSCVSSKLGMMAFGKTLQLQAKVQLIAPAVIREQLSMRKLKKSEENIKSSDYKKEADSKEPKQDS